MFGRKKMQKEIDSLKKQIDMLWNASHIKVFDSKRSINMNPYFQTHYYKSTELGVADIVCRIMGHLGLELEYKDGKPERKKIPSGACLVKNSNGVREVIG